MSERDLTRTEQMSQRQSQKEKEINVLRKKIEDLVEINGLMYADIEESKMKEFFVAKYQKLAFG